MKIAIVIDIYQDKGNGTSISARRFVEKLRDRGHQIVVLCTESSETTDNNGISIVEFPIKKIPPICLLTHGIFTRCNLRHGLFLRCSFLC